MEIGVGGEMGVGVGVGVEMGVGVGSGTGTIGLPEATTPDVLPAQELRKRKTEHSRQQERKQINGWRFIVS